VRIVVGETQILVYVGGGGHAENEDKETLAA
jgi:hypothetical protein